jgi:hypothetical protein
LRLPSTLAISHFQLQNKGLSSRLVAGTPVICEYRFASQLGTAQSKQKKQETA